jgi:hypothetical protein
MSRTNHNFVIAYLLLVLLPLIGLGAVLKYGRRLSAPASVDGAWSLQIDAAELSPICGNTIVGMANSTFAIRQSGQNLVLTSLSQPKFTATGTIEGKLLKGRVSPLSIGTMENRCTVRDWLLQGTFDSHAVPKLLSGTLRIDEHDVVFRALMQPTNTSNGER